MRPEPPVSSRARSHANGGRRRGLAASRAASASRTKSARRASSADSTMYGCRFMQSTVRARPCSHIGRATYVSAATYLSWASPSRTASALASARERAPSLRKIAETWWSTVRWETKRRSAISELRRPRATRFSTSNSRAVRPAGFARVARCGPRGQPSYAKFAKPPRDERGGGQGAQSPQVVEREAKSLFLAGPGKRESGFVWAPDLRPALRGALPVSFELKSPGLRDERRRIFLDAGPASPARELPGPPQSTTANGVAKRVLRVGADGVGPPGQPQRLRPCGSNRRYPLQLALVRRELGGLVQGRPVVGLSATGVRETQHDERDDPRKRNAGSTTLAGVASIASPQRPRSSSIRAL